MSGKLARQSGRNLPIETDSGVRLKYLVLVCSVASLGGVLFGFDTAVISGVVETVRNQFSLTAVMEGWFTSSVLVGCIIGAAFAGVLGDKYGRKRALVGSAILFLISAIYSTIPETLQVLILARIACGVGVGLASVIAPLYISEFAPSRLRGRLVTFYQLSIVIGVLSAYLSNWAILQYATKHPNAFSAMFNGWLHRVMIVENWRGMFGAEVLPAIVFLILLLMVPETPRWLISVGREEEGRKILGSIAGPQAAQLQFAEIKRSFTDVRTNFLELFQPGFRRALVVGVMLSVFGQLSGVNIIVYYGPKILMAAGFANAGAYLGQVGFGLINFVFTVIALLLIDRVGRRPLLIGGMAVVTCTLGAIGAVFYFITKHGAHGNSPESIDHVSSAVGLWIGGLICVYMACIALSICAVIWVLTPEIFPNRVRGRGMSIATLANWLTNAFSAFIFPWYVARFGMSVTFLTTAFICLVATIYFKKYVPETKGMSLEDVEKNWQRLAEESGDETAALASCAKAEE